MYLRFVTAVSLLLGVMAQPPAPVKEIFSCPSNSLTGPLEVFTHDVAAVKLTCQYNGLICTYDADTGASLAMPPTHWCPPSADETCS